MEKILSKHCPTLRQRAVFAADFGNALVQLTSPTAISPIITITARKLTQQCRFFRLPRAGQR
ncbi:hypothetical protein [Runella sp.]|uniref:hypothetical protein n=1 Tax=Runella sp. TaxID=1960881 RepID=UPI003D11141C